MALAYSARDNGDVELAREGLVSGQVTLGFGARQDKVWVLGHPGCEMVFWEDGEVASGGGGFANGGFCLGKVCGWVDGLEKKGSERKLVVVMVKGDVWCCRRGVEMKVTSLPHE